MTEHVAGEPEVATGNCPECNKGDLITITMALGDSQLCFTACHFCQAKWWERDGEAVAVSSVFGEGIES